MTSGLMDSLAMLSGDNTLLEKAKVEKKVAQLEGWKSAHYKEVARNRYNLENAESELAKVKETLTGLGKDVELYHSKLQFNKEGNKLNPVNLSGYGFADSEALGKKIIEFYRNWKPKKGESEEKQIGSLYGFNLFIRQERENYEEGGLFKYKLQNILFAEGPGGVKYLANGGHPNVDNPKLAARYYLNAIDKVNGLQENYQKKQVELEKEMPVLLELSRKTFERDDELNELRVELGRLDGEISPKVRETEMKAISTDEECEIVEKEHEVEIDESENFRPSLN